MTPIVIANWKMHLGERESVSLANSMRQELSKIKNIELVLVPSFPALVEVGQAIQGSNLTLGAQDVSLETKGAATGDVSATMLKELGVCYVIVGHSERRLLHGETDEIVHQKIDVAFTAGITPVLCVGESAEERERGNSAAVVCEQVEKALWKLPARNVVIAYEPIWAIGTGNPAKPADVAEMHALIRGMVGKKARIIYGGSVDGVNAKDFLQFPEIQGFLVGGNSLHMQSLSAIVQAVTTRAV